MKKHFLNLNIQNVNQKGQTYRIILIKCKLTFNYIITGINVIVFKFYKSKENYNSEYFFAFILFRNK